MSPGPYLASTFPFAVPNGHEKWLVVDKVQDSDDKFLLSEQEDPVSGRYCLC